MTSWGGAKDYSIFKKHPIHGVKAKDFSDWCKVAEMMKDKKYLTREGFQEIKKKLKQE